MKKRKELISLLAESILIREYSKTIGVKISNYLLNNIRFFNSNFINPKESEELVDIMKFAEKNAYKLGEALEIDSNRIKFSMDVIGGLRDVMDDEELKSLIEMHLTCSDEDFERMLQAQV